MVGIGVLADVERRELEPEGGDRPDDAGERPGRGELAGIAGQRCAHEFEVGDQFGRSAIVATGHSWGAGREAGSGVRELRLDAPGLQPVRLLGVDPAIAAGQFGQRVEIGGERRGQVQRYRPEPAGHRHFVDERVHRLLGGLYPVLVLDAQHVAGDLRGHVRVAVPVAADPAAEGDRSTVRRCLYAQLEQRLGQIGEHLWGRVGVQVAQVVDGVAGLVGRVRAVHPQLVRLPQQVDQFGQAGVGFGARPGRRAVQCGSAGLDVELVRDRPQFRQDRAARSLGRVCREDGTDRQAAGGRGDVIGGHALGIDLRGRRVQPTAELRAPAREVARPVRLFGDVRELEVRGERAGEFRAGRHVHCRECASGRGRIRPYLCSYLLDQIKEGLTLLPDQRLAEQCTEPPDVGSQGGFGVRSQRRAGAAWPGTRGRVGSGDRRHVHRGHLAGGHPMRLVARVIARRRLGRDGPAGQTRKAIRVRRIGCHRALLTIGDVTEGQRCPAPAMLAR